MWSRSSLSFCRSSCSGGDIMATGAFAGSQPAVQRCTGGGGSTAARGRRYRPCLERADSDARLGAMIAFSTFAEPQTGQVTSDRLRLLVVSGGILEPALEAVAGLAGERVADHSGSRTA